MLTEKNSSSILLNVDGVMRPTLNNTGVPISETNDGLLTFWRWFGNSSATDSEGRPLVLYHGTNIEFDTFDPNLVGSNYPDSAGGFFFTDDLEAAQEYAEDTASEKGGDPAIFSAYLKIDHPLIADTEHSNPDKYYDRNRFRLLNQASDEESDGILVRSTYRFDIAQSTFVVFFPEQIESVNRFSRFSLELVSDLKNIENPVPGKQRRTPHM